MIEYIFVICALTLYSPFYDCDEKWIIKIFDTSTIECIINGNSQYLLGCYHWYNDRNPIIKLANSYNGTVLWHEIKHIQCRCNYH